MHKPPSVIYLQFYGDDRPEDIDLDAERHEVTWSADKIFPTDVRYVLDKRHRRGPKRKVKKP